MAIIPWEPLKDIERFFEEDWDFLPLLPIKGLKVPEADIYETDKDLIIEMPLAGVKPEDVEISLQDNVLTIKGEMKEEKEEKERNYYRKEIKRGKFERSFALPTEVKGEKATAESENGILRIILPKVKVAKAGKKIAIKVKK